MMLINTEMYMLEYVYIYLNYKVVLLITINIVNQRCAIHLKIHVKDIYSIHCHPINFILQANNIFMLLYVA